MSIRMTIRMTGGVPAKRGGHQNIRMTAASPDKRENHTV